MELIYDESYWIQPDQMVSFEYEAESGLDTKGIEILAVVFDDQTGDGSQEAIRSIREYRSGIKTAIVVAMPRLEETLTGHKQALQSAIERVSSEVSAILETQESLPYNTRLGIHDQKWRIAQELHQLTQDHPGHEALSAKEKEDLQQGGLTQAVSKYRRMLMNLKAVTSDR
jgi:hypothetical protein